LRFRHALDAEDDRKAHIGVPQNYPEPPDCSGTQEAVFFDRGRARRW